MSRNAPIIILAAVGVIVSWAYFIPSALELGYIGGWRSAFTSPAFSVGLHWDLVFCDLIVFAMAFADRDRLGKGYLVGTIAMGLTLGVCAALAVYAVGSRRPVSGRG